MPEETPNFATKVVATLEDLRAQANSIQNNLSSASSIYLTISNASSTYFTQENAENKIGYDVISAKGDLIVGIASASTFTLPIGEEGYALVSASAEPTGIKWAIPAAGAKGGALDKVFWENDTLVTTNYTISSGKNAGTFGPVEIQSGVTVEIPEGSVWVIV